MNEFEKLVLNMRQAQKNYFKTRLQRWLKTSKELEAQVDKHLAKLNKPELF